MHKLLARQLRCASRDGGATDVEALLALVNQSYEETDRERRLNSRAMQLMEDELRELMARETQAKLAAEAANTLKSQFLAMMSHELKTPLNAILGFADLIRSQTIRADRVDVYADYASRIHESGTLLLGIISQILDLSKIEAGRYDLDLEPISLIEMARFSLAMLKPLADSRAIALALEAPETDVRARADVRALKQILLNVAGNAVKFTPHGGRVAIRVQSEADAAIVLVEDTGIGIAPEGLALIFEPFRQLCATRGRQFEGTGLGLAITRRLTELHGGKIEIESRVGEGTRVKLALPVCG
ncbi:MAG: HAMP domain-containing sensor histidine kinase [Alphaproteobacteria bacterium]